MPLPQMASRIAHTTRGLNAGTAYGKRMERLSNRIFGEVCKRYTKKYVATRNFELGCASYKHEIDEGGPRHGGRAL